MKKRKDCIYYYYFEETNSIYVGRTIQRKIRHWQHTNEIDRDTVAKYAYENGFQVPEMVIIEDGLTVKQGQKQEGFWVDFYKTHGYNVLNKAKTGATGTLINGKWTKEKCLEEALKYRTKKDFERGNPKAYQAAYKYGWIEDFTHFENGNKIQADKKRYWTKERCAEEALKYKTKKDFRKYSNIAYQTCVKNKWLKMFTHFENGFINNANSKKVRQYTKDGQFVAEYLSIADAARQNGIKSQSNISSCCNGNPNYSHAHGFIWKYAV